MSGHFFGYRRAAVRALALVLLSAAFIFLAAADSNAELSTDERRLLSEISTDRIMAVIHRLCSREFGGRRAGSPEQCAAADYLAAGFAGLGLDPAPGMEDYKQPLTIRYALVRSKDEIKATLSYVSARSGRSTVRSFAYRDFSGRGGFAIRSRVIFVGYGIHDPAAGYDDYAGLDAAGKIVLWLPGRPRGGMVSKCVTLSHKMQAAYQQGALACLVYKPADPWGTNMGLAGPIADFPCVAVDDMVAGELLAPAGLRPGKLLDMEASKLPRGAAGAEVTLAVTPVCDPTRLTYNVLAALPGTDPTASQEVVVLGAHYDHIGDTADGRIFPGADDNASGTAVVLEVAAAIKRAGIRPRRTIVFAAWTGEEGGLLGSSHFAANPPFPLADIKSNFTLDMVGVGDSSTFAVTGANAFPRRYQTLAASAGDLAITLRPDAVPGASDNLALARKKVPSLLIHSVGAHANYHSTRDTPAAIDRAVLRNASRLAALAVWRAAND